MAHISYPDSPPPDSPLAEIYKRIATRCDGVVPNLLRVQAHDPAALQACLDLHHRLMLAPAALSQAQCEMIAVVVSQLNECYYGLQHHGASLRRLVNDDAFVARLESDFRGVDLPPADCAMLEYAAKITRTPQEVTIADVDGLRDVGFSDAAILHICLVTAFVSFANRIADGLGVELEPKWPQRAPYGASPL
jgi:uncharacterized peroxidase-related enzyme